MLADRPALPGALSLGNPHGVPLLSVPGLSRRFSDPWHWADTINAAVPLNICEPQPLRQPFFSQLALCNLGSVDLLASWGSPLQVEAREHGLSLLTLKYGGTTVWDVGGGRFEVTARSASMLFLPALPFRLFNTLSCCVIAFVRVATLLETAAAMLGPEVPLERLTVRLQEPRILQDGTTAAATIQALSKALAMVESLASLDPTTPTLLRCDDLINRIFLHLLIPDLLAGQKMSALYVPAKDQVIDDLVAWMKFNLQRPIALTDLERRSQLSRRTLQYAWRQRFGLSPMQWLKAQRLDAARQQLRAMAPADTITAVAARCGYTSLPAFSRDFRMRFGVSPSRYLSSPALPS